MAAKAVNTHDTGASAAPALAMWATVQESHAHNQCCSWLPAPGLPQSNLILASHISASRDALMSEISEYFSSTALQENELAAQGGLMYVR